MKVKARVLAFYLPQYHPIPENDRWWGKGFTEWTNVGKAKKYYPGQYEPRVPADLGYYDLRVPETREAQADMARKYGIEGFVYWHYWFGNGKRLLERPFNEVLESGKPNFPFALAWANQSWKGFWHGLKDRNVLIEQTYSGDEDYIEHFNTILPAFKDERYLKCDGKPIFFIYSPEELPNVKHFIELWQYLAQQNGLKGIFFVAIRHNLYDLECAKHEIDQWKNVGFESINVVNSFGKFKYKFWFRLLRSIFFKRLRIIPDLRLYESRAFKSPVDSDDFVIPSVLPDWDHTPRSGREGVAFVGSTPEKFKLIVKETLDSIMNKPFDRRFLMVKSWNEWAEGNYLEPDLRYGCQYLEAFKTVISEDN